MRIAIAALLSAAALALAACGAAQDSASDFQGEEKAVAQAVEDIQDDSTDAAKVCKDLLSRALVQKIEQSGAKCADQLGDTLDDADDTELAVVDVTVSGSTARAVVKGGSSNDDRRATFLFVREGGRWRASAFSSGQQR